MRDRLSLAEDIARQVVPPDFDSLGATCRSRRRGRSVLLGGLAATAAIAIALAAANAGDHGMVVPAHTPSHVERTRAIEWEAGDVIGHPGAQSEMIRASDPDYRAGSVAPGDSEGSLTIWTRCKLPPSRDPGPCIDPVPVVARSAVEVTRPGASPVTVILPPTREMAEGWWLIRQGVRYVGDGHFYLARPTPVLLSAGSAAPVPLTTTSGTVAARPGVMAVPCSAAPPYELCMLDLDSLTLTPIDLPRGVDWSPSTTLGFWGVRDRDVFWQDPDGQLKTRTLLTDVSRHLNVPLDVPEGVIVASESLIDGAIIADVIHVSEDRGATWRTLLSPIGDHGDGRLPSDWRSWKERRP